MKSSESSSGNEWWKVVKVVQAMNDEKYGLTNGALHAKKADFEMIFETFKQKAVLDRLFMSRPFLFLFSRYTKKVLTQQIDPQTIFPYKPSKRQKSMFSAIFAGNSWWINLFRQDLFCVSWKKEQKRYWRKKSIQNCLKF